ncbi:hypothetical protein V2J09_013207 [Rumex salicifolius]
MKYPPNIDAKQKLIAFEPRSIVDIDGRKLNISIVELQPNSSISSFNLAPPSTSSGLVLPSPSCLLVSSPEIHTSSSNRARLFVLSPVRHRRLRHPRLRRSCLRPIVVGNLNHPWLRYHRHCPPVTSERPTKKFQNFRSLKLFN